MERCVDGEEDRSVTGRTGCAPQETAGTEGVQSETGPTGLGVFAGRVAGRAAVHPQATTKVTLDSAARGVRC